MRVKQDERYKNFLANKVQFNKPKGFNVEQLNPMLYDFQSDIVKWSLMQGMTAIFADCGLGKTPMQLEWAQKVCEHTGGNVLILAPLAVSQQTVREGDKFGIKVKYCRNQKDVEKGITITNYEMLDAFDGKYQGVVLDESSILKSYSGVFRNKIIERFVDTDFKLACTATPAPNDYMELANHAEFLGILKRQEMLSMFFVHDGGDTQQWRLKGHAEDKFWEWLCSWSVMIKRPSDLGYDDNGFILPELNIEEIVVPVDLTESTNGMLFRMPDDTLQGRQKERRSTVDIRVSACASLINGNDEPWIVWCNLNDESAELTRSIKKSVEIKGSDKRQHKEDSMMGFSDGSIKRLITKPKIAGFGMNWQHCNNIAFVGLSDSYEQFYQAVRRCWRFGQKKPVNCYIITAETEGVVVENIKRKEKNAAKMATEMVKHMSVYNKENIKMKKQNTKEKYVEKSVDGDTWQAQLGDCVEVLGKIESDSVHYSVFSPPFADLYTYTNSDRDLGNTKNDQEFYDHFNYMVEQLYRVIMPGRVVSFHCMNLPTTKTHHGYIGLRDFRGNLIRCFESKGFIFHSEVCIWKCPVVQVTRTKALGLLHKQMTKDSAMSRQGLPDYLVTMRKPGENPQPISGELDRFVGDESTFERKGKLSIDIWQKYASPVWMDINPTRTLQKSSARENKDEKHICPLQLDVIERAIQLWTNENDIVLSPFMGIGSEGYVAIKMGRRFIGIELKESYFKQAVLNLQEARRLYHAEDLFGQENE